MKKLFAVLISMMLVNFTPTMAFAASATDCTGDNSCTHLAAIGNTHYDTLQEAIAEASNTEITLLSDIDLSESGYITSTKDVTINLNNHTISNKENFVFFIKSGKMTLTGTGVIRTYAEDGETVSEAVKTRSAIYIGNTAADNTEFAELLIDENVTLNAETTIGITAVGNKTTTKVTIKGKINTTLDGTSAVTGNGSSGQGNTEITIEPSAVLSAPKSMAIYHPQNGILNINGGKLTGATAVYIKSGTVTVKDGEFSGTKTPVDYEYTGNGALATGDAIVMDSCNYPGGAPKLIIEGGTFSGTKDAIGYYTEHVTTETEKGTVSVSGGTFSSDVKDYLAEGCGFNYANNQYTVTVTDPLAKIGDKAYVNLQTALDAASSTDTVVLSKDIALAYPVNIEKTVTLDLNGYTISQAADFVSNGAVNTPNTHDYLIGIKRGGKLTIDDSSEAETGAVKYDENIASTSDRPYCAVKMTISGEEANGEAAELIVNGGTLQGYYYGVMGNGGRHNTKITINGGKISGYNPDDSWAIYNPQSGEVIITDGELTGTTVLGMKSGKLTISGGVFYANGAFNEYKHNDSGIDPTGDAIYIEACNYPGGEPVVVNISGGIFTSDNNQAIGYYKYTDGETGEEYTLANEKFISGGTFSSDVSDFAASGYKATQSGAAWIVSGSQSGGAAATIIQKPEITVGEGGNVSTADNGSTAFITADSGYEIASVSVNGKNMGIVDKLTDLKTGDKVVISFKKTAEAQNAELSAQMKKLQLMARSERTARGHIKVTLKTDEQTDTAIKTIKNLGYTVKYKYYRSTVKNVEYKPMLEKKARNYTNTMGNKGVRYFYRARVMVYDASGELVAQTALKQCKYACRIR